ncbi:hypothetical protein ACVHNB_35975 [Streptomyces sp. YJ-C3]
MGQNPEGYAAIEVGQKDYMSRLMEYHLNPELPEDMRYSDDPETTIKAIGQSSGQVSGVLGLGRQEELAGPSSVEDEDYGKSMAQYKNLISGTAGTITGVGTSFIATPWAGALVGGAVGTVTGSVLEGVFADAEGHALADSADERGDLWQVGREENNTRTSQAARLAAEKYGDVDASDAAGWARAAADQGFINARPVLDGQAPGSMTTE